MYLTYKEASYLLKCSLTKFTSVIDRSEFAKFRVRMPLRKIRGKTPYYREIMAINYCDEFLELFYCFVNKKMRYSEKQWRKKKQSVIGVGGRE